MQNQVTSQEFSKPEQTMQCLIYTHIWTYILELEYLVQMLDKGVS